MSLTLEQVQAELLEVAQAKVDKIEADDFYYRSEYNVSDEDTCLYVDPQKTHAMCLIGVWLHEKHGVSLEDLYENVEGNNAEEAITILFPETPHRARYFAQAVQELQDDNTGWLAAVKQVTEDYKERADEDELLLAEELE